MIMLIDPEHQRSPDVKNIREGKASRMPLVPRSEQIFKCVHCGNHRYCTEDEAHDKTCKDCRRAKNIGDKTEAKPADQGSSVSGHDLGNGSHPYTGDSGDESDHLQR